MNIFRQKLAEPFASNDIEWRVQRAGMSNGSPWAHVLPYLTARAVQERMDDVFGIAGWRNEYKAAPDGGVLCGIACLIEGKWVMKWDGAENTQIEAVKGGISDSFKRAGVVWGVGRYLYKTGTYFAICHTDQYSGQHRQKFADKWDKEAKPIYGSWDEPQLPDFALPYHIQKQRCDNLVKQLHEAKDMKELQFLFGKAYKWADKEMNSVDFVKRIEQAKNTAKNDLRVKAVKENKQ